MWFSVLHLLLRHDVIRSVINIVHNEVDQHHVLAVLRPILLLDVKGPVSSSITSIFRDLETKQENFNFLYSNK